VQQTLSSTRRVLLVEDNVLLADAFRTFLQNREISVIGTAATAREAVEIARAERPDVILIDIGLPDGNGIDLGRRLLQEMPEAILIALTASNDRSSMDEAIRSGFRAYLTKDMPITTVLASIEAVADGQVVISAATNTPAPSRRLGEPGTLLAQQLTARERQVLSLVVHGASTKQIGRRLGVSNHTARTHVENGFAKLQVHSRLEAVAFALRHGIVELDNDRVAPPRGPVMHST
jgi:DNA-binding NarL/FixJ family response regulator